MKTEAEAINAVWEDDGGGVPSENAPPKPAGNTYLADRETVIAWAWERHKIRLAEMKIRDVRETCDRLLGKLDDEDPTLADLFALWAAKVREEG